MERKVNTTFSLKGSTIDALDRLVTIQGIPSRSELGRDIIEGYLAQKKIKELLINN